MTEKCIFCEWVGTGQGNIFYQNKLFVSRFDLFPVSPGHVTIIPRRHVVDIASLSPEEWTLLQPSIREVIDVIENTDLRKIYQGMIDDPYSEISTWFCRRALAHPRINTQPDAYNYGVNDGRAAGRTVDHFHWHIIPRFEGDMVDPRGGVRYVIPEMGNYKIPR